MRQPVFAALVACCTARCYYYQPLATPDPPPGTYLAAPLTDTGADHLARTIGPDVRAVRGRLLTSDSGGLTFSVSAVSLHHGADVTWKGEAVTLNREYLIGLQQRKLARGRTLLLASATLIGVVTTYKVFQGIGLTPGNTGGGSSSR